MINGQPPPDSDLCDNYGRETKWYDYIGVFFLVLSPFIALFLWWLK